MDQNSVFSSNNIYPKRILNRYWIMVMTVALAFNFGMVIMDNSVVLYGTSLGYSNAKAGLFTTFFSIAAIVFRILGGVFSDRIGRRFTMIAGTIVFAASIFIFGAVPIFALMLIMRILNGAGFGLTSVAASAANADVIPPKKIKMASMLFYVPMALAYVLCGYIVQAFTGKENFRGLFLLNTGILIVGLIAALLCRYEGKRAGDISKASYTKKGIETFFEKSALPSMCVGVFVALSIALCTTFIMKYAEVTDTGVQGGLFFTIMGLVMLGMNLLSGIITQKTGSLPFLVIVFAFYGISTVLLGITGAPFFFYMLAVALGLVSGGCTPTLFSIVAQRAPADRRGTASSTYLISNDIGIAGGAVLWGAVVDGFGYSIAFVFDGVCIAIALILSIILFRGENNNFERK